MPNDNSGLTKITVAVTTAAFNTVHTESFLEESHNRNYCDGTVDNDIQQAVERALRSARVHSDIHGMRITVEIRQFERPEE